MAFAVDDIVTIMPKDPKHPVLKGQGYARVLDINVNGKAGLNRVAVLGIPGALFLMEDADLAAYVGPVPNRLARSLPSPSKPTTGHR